MNGEQREQTGNGIGWAVKQLDHGLRVTRPGWNGKGMYLKMLASEPNRDGSATERSVWMKTVQGTFVPWTCSQTDLLARDWEVVS